MFWHYYDYISVVVIVSQLFFLFQTYRNFLYALNKASKKHDDDHPLTLLTVPCKGIDNAFEKNITSLFDLDYENYHLCFVVESEDDRAYEKLCELRDRLSAGSKAIDVKILVAGLATGCSQKIHNLLCSCQRSPEDVKVFAFADSDACLHRNWLSHLVYPLRKSKYGASTGYRWFIPEENNLASLALSAINAKIAQLLGKNRFNQAWGGSMAIRRETFYQIGLDKAWPKAISDDLCLSYLVKKAGMKIIFAPACLVASYEKTSWLKLFEFARRQFLITRITMVSTWLFGFFSIVYSLSGLWAGAGIALLARGSSQANIALYTTVPIVFLVSQFCRTILRQKMITKLLPEEVDKMRIAIIADVFGTFLWSWVLFICIAASGFGRTITWRGVRYKLISPTETIIQKG